MKIFAAIDIGTNSVRLEVVRVEKDHSLTTLSQQKQMVRLGEGQFADGRMHPDAIQRGVTVISKFADMARGFGADEIVAIATSAVREAENRDEIIERLRKDAGIDVRVISGPEEARLIYLGVSSGANLGDRRALFVDIGGGSTELILGDSNSYSMLDSVKLGSIRVSNKFLAGEKGPIAPERFKKMVEYARAVAGHTTRKFNSFGYDLLFGSAGTITSLAEVTARRIGDAPTSLRNYELKISDVKATIEHLCKLTLEERRKVPGLDPDRADIILGGAAVLSAIMQDSSAQILAVSDRGLRHGILLDRMMQEDLARTQYETTSVRDRSILQLARTCSFDEDHANHIARLCLKLYDELRRLGLHPYGARERDLLRYGAYVHDIGCFLSHSNHQRHAYYLVRHSDLLGFNDTEIDVIANIALYHRKSMPKKKHENLADLSRSSRKLVEALAAIMRIAEGLDRSHLALVEDVALDMFDEPRRMKLTIISPADCQLELWGVETGKDLWEATFGMPLEFQVVSPTKKTTTQKKVAK